MYYLTFPFVFFDILNSFIEVAIPIYLQVRTVGYYARRCHDNPFPNFRRFVLVPAPAAHTQCRPSEVFESVYVEVQLGGRIREVQHAHCAKNGFTFYVEGGGGVKGYLRQRVQNKQNDHQFHHPNLLFRSRAMCVVVF